MKSKQIDTQPLTYALIFDKGDEFLSGMQRFAEEARLAASQFTAIGAFSPDKEREAADRQSGRAQGDDGYDQVDHGRERALLVTWIRMTAWPN